MEEEKLKYIDMEGISEAILTMVAGYPELPFVANSKTVQWQSLDANEGIGIFTMSGAVYLRKYVSGSYVAQMPFQLMYRCTPTTNRARMSSQEFVEGLAKYLEGCTATFKDTHLEMQSIERTSPVLKREADNDGNETYMVAMNCKYYFKK